MSTRPNSFLTPEQYLEIERKAERKSEYYNGEMFAMSGARIAHNDVVSNLTIEIGLQLRGRPCRIRGSDMRVCVGPAGFYTYPDLSIVCGQPKLLDDHFDTLMNPTVIIEVLSPSTEAYDRLDKFDLYKLIDSLREYLLVSTERMRVDQYTRQADGKWLLFTATGPEEVVELQSTGCRVKLAHIYDSVEFKAQGGPRFRPSE